MQASVQMTEIQHNELGYVYSLYSGPGQDDYFRLTDDNSINRTISYNTYGFPFVDAQFIIHFQFDSNLDTIIDNSCITEGNGYSFEMPSGSPFIIVNNQSLFPLFIEDTYFEPEEKRYILILSLGI